MTVFADAVIKESTELKDDVKKTLEEMINVHTQEGPVGIGSLSCTKESDLWRNEVSHRFDIIFPPDL